MKAKKLLSLLLVFVLAVSLVSTAFAAGTKKTFSDVDSAHWAREFVDRLVAAGAADGYPDGTFKPSQHITRVEFMKLLNGVCGFTAKSDDVAKYTDVQAPWKVEQVAVALAAGYTNGTGAVTEAGIAGVIFPVKVLLSALEGFKEVKDDDVITYEMNVRGTMTPFELKGPKALAENPDYSYYKLSKEPAGYKAMTVTDGKAAFGRVTATANVIEGAGGTVAYAAHHADLEIKTSGIEVDAADVSAVIVTTDSGAKYALHHVVNIWRGTELGWNDTDLDLYGQTLTNLRFCLKDGTVNDYPVNIILKLHAEGASAVFADEKTVAVTGLPADIANPVATVKSVVGRGQTAVVLAENVPVTDGKVALSDSPVDGTNYQVTIVSDNYADVSVTLSYNVGK